MMEISKIHEMAMELADKAYIARLHGDLEAAERFTREAFEKEKEAALLLVDKCECEPTRSVLCRSAASLALESGEQREAERLIGFALSGAPPDEIAEELRDLLEKVNFERHLSLRGLKLGPDEFQFSIWGKLVSYGMAQSEEFISRVQNIERIIYRTAERRLKRPFKEAGRRKKDLEKELELYVSVPRAASFAVSFRLGSSRQSMLPGMPGMALSEDVINEMFECFDLLNTAKMIPLEEKFEDKVYYTNFIQLAQKIAPDGENIKSVGLTRFKNNKETSVVLSTPKSQIVKHGEREETREAREQVEVTGTLRYADDTKRKGVIKIIDENDKAYRVRVPSGMMADIVRPMFDFEVVATGYREKGVIILENIDLVSE